MGRDVEAVDAETVGDGSEDVAGSDGEGESGGIELTKEEPE